MHIGRSFAPFAVLALAHCSLGELEPVDIADIHEVDNRVQLSGDFCSAKPIEEQFPVKIMLIMDGSGSLQFTDEGAIRVQAVNELLNHYAGNDSVKFHVTIFNTFLTNFPPMEAPELFVDAFTLTSTNNMNAQMQVAEVLTDYQAALANAWEIIRQDAGAGGNDNRNTKYVVIFFSDGQPGPICCECSDEVTRKPGPGTDANGCLIYNPPPVSVDPQRCRQSITNAERLIGFSQDRVCDGVFEYNICNATTTDMNIDDENRWFDQFPDLPTGKNYNRDFQILELVEDLVDLAKAEEVGAFEFHTIMLWNENLPDGIVNIIGLDECKQRELLQEMARLGGGEFREARSADEIDFLQFDFTALKRTNKVRRIFVTNRNLLPGENDFLVDSDGDGLADQDEYTIGSNVALADTDDDGYTDAFELEYQGFGMDPILGSKPYVVCRGDPEDDTELRPGGLLAWPESQAMDNDHDGLRNCEERLVGLDVDHPDSDRDTIPDGLELRFRLNPAMNDAELDYDFDGISNLEEVIRNSNPRLDDPVLRRKPAFRYDLRMDHETLDQRECFGLETRHIVLGSTTSYFRPHNDLPQSIDAPGYNEILVYEVESPSDDALGETAIRGACYRARFIAPDIKEPADGLLAPALEDVDLINILEGSVFTLGGEPVETTMSGADCKGLHAPCGENDECRDLEGSYLCRTRAGRCEETCQTDADCGPRWRCPGPDCSPRWRCPGPGRLCCLDQTDDDLCE